MNTPPNLDDPAQRALYRAELRDFDRPFRLFAVGFTVLATLAMLFGAPWIARPCGWVLVGLGVLLMLVALVRRNLYHWRRMGWRRS